MDLVKDLIRQAIRQGAPVYNQGSAGGCYEIYKAAANQILETGLVSDASGTAKTLRSALQQSANITGDADKQAWVMRHAFDSVLDGSSELEIPDPSALLSQGVSDYIVLDLTQPTPSSQPSWFGLDDVIMGGVSSSSIQYDPSAQSLVFSGLVTTESNGGFASVRSQPWTGWAKFGQSQGMRLVVKGDGRVYKITAKTDDMYDGVQYQHDFATGAPSTVLSRTPPSQPVPEGWQCVDLPFSNFTPNFRGRPVRNQPPLVGGRIRQLGLMVSKFAAEGGTTPGFRSGPFKLALRSVHAFF